jgi:hypothetical protein
MNNLSQQDTTNRKHRQRCIEGKVSLLSVKVTVIVP